MNVLDVYEAVLIELNKVEAPSLLLEDFIYFLNKAIQQYQNRMYNAVDSSQQKTDDLLAFYKEKGILTDRNIVEIDIKDYCHCLGCDITFIDKCGKEYTKAATKYTTNIDSAVKDNYYLKPSFKRPYFSIKDVGANSINVKLDHGDDRKYKLKSIVFKYLKTPTKYTLDDIDVDALTGTDLEFSNYVCYEIINDLVKLILENASDPRLQSNMPINQSIAVPGQQSR